MVRHIEAFNAKYNEKLYLTEEVFRTLDLIFTSMNAAELKKAE